MAPVRFTTFCTDMAGERSCPVVGTLKRQARRSLRPQKIKAAPHNSARSLRQDFCSNSKFRKWRNTVCISHFRNCGSGAKRRLRLADAIVRCCLSKDGRSIAHFSQKRNRHFVEFSPRRRNSVSTGVRSGYGVDKCPSIQYNSPSHGVKYAVFCIE